MTQQAVEETSVTATRIPNPLPIPGAIVAKCTRDRYPAEWAAFHLTLSPQLDQLFFLPAPILCFKQLLDVQDISK